MLRGFRRDVGAEAAEQRGLRGRAEWCEEQPGGHSGVSRGADVGDGGAIAVHRDRKEAVEREERVGAPQCELGKQLRTSSSHGPECQPPSSPPTNATSPSTDATVGAPPPGGEYAATVGK